MKEADLTGVPPSATRWDGDIKQGFVYRRVPHITLKSIANNPDIHEGMTRDQHLLRSLGSRELQQLNALLRKVVKSLDDE